MRHGYTIVPGYITVCGQLTGYGFNIEFAVAPPRPLVVVSVVGIVYSGSLAII